MRKFVRTTVAVLLLGVVAVPLAAQDIRPLSSGGERSGFWWGIGLGAASAQGDYCSGCEDFPKSTFPMLDIHLGGTLSPQWRIGAQITGGQKSDAFFEDPDTDENIGDVSVSAFFYPSATGNFWLQGGLGGVAYQAKGGGETYTYVGGAAILGAGYDFRVGTNMSITPALRIVAGGAGDIKDSDDVVQADDFKVTFVQLGVSVIWH